MKMSWKPNETEKTTRYVCVCCLNTTLDNRVSYCQPCLECGDQMCPLTDDIREEIAQIMLKWRKGK